MARSRATALEERFSGMQGPWCGCVLAGAVLGAALWSVTVPTLTKFRGGRPFWRKCGRLIRNLPQGNVIFAGSHPDRVDLYYLDPAKDITVFRSPEEFRRHLLTLPRSDRKAAAAVIIRRRDVQKYAPFVIDTGWEWREHPEVGEGTPLRQNCISRQSASCSSPHGFGQSSASFARGSAPAANSSVASRAPTAKCAGVTP